MARKGSNPDKMTTEKETESKRRYRSPQTPPQAPRSSPRTQGGEQQGREQGRWQGDIESETPSAGPGRAGRGTDFDLQKASRDELDAIATALGIEDFETMNREELVMEIRERS